MKDYEILINVCAGESTSTKIIYITCNSLEKINDNTVLVDGATIDLNNHIYEIEEIDKL